MIELPDALAVAVVLLGCIMITAFFLREAEIGERRVLSFACAMHISFALALKYSHGNVFTEGDLWAYRDFSTPLVALAQQDPFHYVPQLFRALLRLHNDFGFAGSDPTENMIPATALARLAAFDSLYAVYILVGWLSFMSKWGVYATFRSELPMLDRRFIAIAAMCIPSVVFWSSGIVKEAYACIGFGPLMLGARLCVRSRWVKGIPLIVLGAWIIAAFKPYLLFPFGVGASVWFTFEKSSSARQHAMTYLGIGVGVGYLAILGLGILFPQFSPKELSEQTASLQTYGAAAEGGSNYTINAGDQSLSGQLIHAPLALLTTLARPAPWEAHNLTSAVAALEMTVLTFLFGRSLLKGKAIAIRTAFTHPITIFAVVFVLLGGTAIGLATTNFGTLSRYRVPIMPFYGIIVAVLTLSVEAEQRARLAAARNKDSALAATAATGALLLAVARRNAARRGTRGESS